MNNKTPTIGTLVVEDSSSFRKNVWVLVDFSSERPMIHSFYYKHWHYAGTHTNIPSLNGFMNVWEAIVERPCGVDCIKVESDVKEANEIESFKCDNTARIA